MTAIKAKFFRRLILVSALLGHCSFLGCANPKQNAHLRRMTLGQEYFSRTVFEQSVTINRLRDRLDQLAPGESSKFAHPNGLAPEELSKILPTSSQWSVIDPNDPPWPAEGPEDRPHYAEDIPAAGPDDLTSAELKKLIQKQDAVIRALRARIKELEKKESEKHASKTG